MELALKIDLTDEQYDELMKTSYEKLFESGDFQRALAGTVSNEIGEYLKKNPEIIKGLITRPKQSNYSWGYNNSIYDPSDLMIQFIKEPMDEYKGIISDVIKDDIVGIIKKADWNFILHNIIVNAVIRGFDRTSDEWKEVMYNTVTDNTTRIDNLISRLGISID